MGNKAKTKHRPICSAVYDRDSGVILRILKSTDACTNWIHKHFPGESRPISPFYTKSQVNCEFDKQMKLGLNDSLVIEQLLYFGGVTAGKVSAKVKGFC